MYSIGPWTRTIRREKEQLSLPQTAESSVTALLHASGHWQLAVTPSNDGAQLEYRGHVSFEQGSRVPEIKIKILMKKVHE